MLSKYITKIETIGPRRIAYSFWYRYKKKWFLNLHSQKTPQMFRINKSKLSFLHNIQCTQNIIEQAESLLNKKMDWHAGFDATAFYTNVQIPTSNTGQRAPDIKNAWDPSRCTHVFYFGKAWQQTNGQVYADAFANHVTDFIEQNPYLYGPNWFNAMEVGLRALNWIIAYNLFTNKSVFSQKFIHNFCSSLWQHKEYISYNWEWYDGRTSNHYLSNVVAYLYLCWFWNEEKELHKTIQKLFYEFEWQVLLDGACHEGSTKYHAFNTQLFAHAWLLCNELHIEWPQKYIDMLQKMIAFIVWCTPENGKLITIGDDDSGVVTVCNAIELLPFPKNKTVGTKDFKNFGLSIIKTKQYHISLRHHAYNKRWPSGHLHNDVGSITLAINGIPFFIDPGSYVYMPSAVWRNRFRSVHAHNTLSINNTEPIPLTNQLFFMSMPESSQTFSSKENSLYTEHNLYHIPVYRTVNFNKQNKELTIVDNIAANKLTEVGVNFTLSPAIQVIQTESGWLLQYNKIQACVSSEVPLKLKKTWIALQYGKKIESYSLQAHIMVTTHTTNTTKVRYMKKLLVFIAAISFSFSAYTLCMKHNAALTDKPARKAQDSIAYSLGVLNKLLPELSINENSLLVNVLIDSKYTADMLEVPVSLFKDKKEGDLVKLVMQITEHKSYQFHLALKNKNTQDNEPFEGALQKKIEEYYEKNT